MGRLIISEFKKIFKSKANIIILLVFFGFTIFGNFNSYNPIYNYDGANTIKDGKVLSDYEILKNLDEDAQKFTGKIDKDKAKTMRNEYLALMAKTKEGDSIDDKRMKEAFGNDYQSYLDKVANRQINEDEFYQKYCANGCSFSVEQDAEGNTVFPVYYKNDGIRRYYNLLYYDVSGRDSVIEDEEVYESTNPYYILSHKSEFLYPNGKYHENLFYGMDQNKDKDVLLKYFSDKIETNSNEYHSTAANNVFLGNVTGGTSVFILLLIAILLANIFANETYYKTDQIIVPSKTGNTKITIAKCITGALLAIGVILLQWIIAFVIACIRLPLHDLNSVVITQFNTYAGMLNYAFTYSEVFISGFCIAILSAIVTAAITMTFSYFTRNRFGTIIPIILFLLIPMFVPIFSLLFKIPFLDFMFPSKAIMFDLLFKSGGMYEGVACIVMGKDVIPMINVNYVVYTVITIILLSAIIIHSKKHKVQNR